MILHNVAALLHLAQREPDRPAVDDGTVRLGIAEVVAWAAAVADEIVSRDPGGSAPVPVLVDRSACSVAGILGVLLAGRAVSAIDGGEPIEHTTRTVTRLGAQLVVDATTTSPGSRNPGVPGVLAAGAGRAVARPVPVDPAAMACVIFTSGSTGVPKGVVYDGLGVERVFARRAQRLSIDAPPKVPVVAPLGWAAGIVRVLNDVALGLELVLLDPTGLSPTGLADWLDAQGFTEFSVTPSMASSWAQQLPPGRRLANVRRVTTVGEGIGWSDIELVRRVVHPEAHIVVGYGASEGGGGLEYRIPPDMPIGAGPVPLGMPLYPDTVHLEPLDGEPGAPTEIVFRPSAAIRYWDDPELTARRFGTGLDGRPFWRSGDLATIGDDGMWVHRGRADLLAKIRGKLVEPAEPERVLAEVPWLRGSVVMPHTLPGGAVRLVAHLEPVVGATLDTDELRRTLHRQLPGHLVPSIFVHHDALPLNDRGKVDRQALTAAPVVPWRARPSRLPAGEVETVVTGIVTDVLGIGSVSPDDDLWDLGCDSLAAAEIVTALERAGFDHVDLAALVDATTPAAIAARLERPVLTDVLSPLARLNRSGSRPPLWVLAGAGGSALAFRALAAELGDDQPVLVLEAHAVHHRGLIALSVPAAARRHLATIRAVQPNGPYVIAGHSAGGLIAYELAQQLVAAGEEARVVIIDMPAGAGGHHRRPDGVDPSGPFAQMTWWQRARHGLGVRARMGATLCGWRSADVGQRYGVFFDLHTRTVRRYEPAPACFPVVVIQQHGGSCAASWAPLVAGLTVHEVDGDHNSMLQRPHVGNVAALLGDLTTAPADQV